MRFIALLGLIVTLVGSGVLVSGSAFAIPGSWSTLALDARMDATMVYDNYGDHFVFFGGTDGYQKFNDTWQMWPGYYVNAWQKMLFSPSIPLPAARDGHTFVWDPVQRRVLLFGGKDANNNILNDVWSLPLWTWDGQAWQPYYGNWQQLTTTGAPGLTQHTAVWDSQRGRMLVYGGTKSDGTLSDQLYALNLQTLAWSVVTIGTPGTGPHGRQGHVSIYDAGHDALMVHGGQEYQNGTFSWASPSVWRLRLSLPTPAWELWASAGSSGVNGGAVYKQDTHEMVIYGGNIPGNPATTFTYKIQLDTSGSSQLVQPVTRIRRERFAYAYDTLRNQLQVFAGTEGALTSQGASMPRNDTWDLTLGANPDWTPTYERPYGGTWVSDASLVYDDQHQRTIMFGGNTILNLQETSVSRVFILGLSGYVDQWAIPYWTGNLPVGRQNHSAIYDRVGDRMVVYGGINGGLGDLSDLFAFNRMGGQDLSSNDYQFVSLPNVGGPGPLSGHTAVYAEISPTNRKMIIFGGRRNVDLKSETWSYDLVNHTWLNLNPGGQTPTARADHGAVYDYVNKRMYIFGGIILDANNNPVPTNDVYYLNLTTNTWTKVTGLTGPKPSARSNMSVVLSPYADGRMIVFGGLGDQGVHLSDTWALKVTDPYGTSWSQITTSGIVPGERQGHVAVYQSGGKVLVAAGRLAGSGPLDEHYNDTWILSYDAGSFASSKVKPAGDESAQFGSPRDRMSLEIVSSSRSGATMQLKAAGDPGPFDLAVYDVAGRLLRRLDVSPLLKESTVTWDFRDEQGKRLPSGIYFMKLKGRDSSIAERIVVLH